MRWRSGAVNGPDGSTEGRRSRTSIEFEIASAMALSVAFC